MQITISSKKDLGNGFTAVSVRPRLGHVDPITGVAFGNEIVLVVPSNHRFCQNETHWVDTGQREPNGNPILKLETRPKSLEELSEYDLLEIVASLTQDIYGKAI